MAHDQADILEWLRYRGSASGEGRQAVSEVLLDASADEIERLQSELDQANAMLEAAREVLPAKPGLLRMALKKRRTEAHK